MLLKFRQNGEPLVAALTVQRLDVVRELGDIGQTNRRAAGFASGASARTVGVIAGVIAGMIAGMTAGTVGGGGTGTGTHAIGSLHGWRGRRWDGRFRL